MGPRQSCTQNPHQKEVFQCMNRYCGDNALICQGNNCAYQSKLNQKTFLCRKCYTAEFCELNRGATQQIVEERIAFEHYTAAEIDEKGNFIFKKDFWEIVRMEDEAKARFLAQYTRQDSTTSVKTDIP